MSRITHSASSVSKVTPLWLPYLAIVKLVVSGITKPPRHHITAYETALSYSVGPPAAIVYTHNTHTCQHM